MPTMVGRRRSCSSWLPRTSAPRSARSRLQNPDVEATSWTGSLTNRKFTLSLTDTFTFTFIGQVVPSPSSTNCVPFPSGYSLLGSPLPANVTNIALPPISLPPIASMQVLTWNGSGFVYSSYDPEFGGWIDVNFKPKPPPSYEIGQGFFMFNPSGVTSWCQSLP